MTNLSPRDRQTLETKSISAASTVAANQLSSDGTRKLLLTWPDGGNAETVMIPDGDRRTACVSSQVGCPVGCKFCASGLNGVKGNLAARPNRRADLPPQPAAFIPAGERITNVVFMGMGEPLANYANVMQAIRVLHDPGCLNIGARRITLSTVGVPSKMRELAN